MVIVSRSRGGAGTLGARPATSGRSSCRSTRPSRSSPPKGSSGSKRDARTPPKGAKSSSARGFSAASWRCSYSNRQCRKGGTERPPSPQSDEDGSYAGVRQIHPKQKVKASIKYYFRKPRRDCPLPRQGGACFSCSATICYSFEA